MMLPKKERNYSTSGYCGYQYSIHNKFIYKYCVLNNITLKYIGRTFSRCQETFYNVLKLKYSAKFNLMCLK